MSPVGSASMRGSPINKNLLPCVNTTSHSASWPAETAATQGAMSRAVVWTSTRNIIRKFPACPAKANATSGSREKLRPILPAEIPPADRIPAIRRFQSARRLNPSARYKRTFPSSGMMRFIKRMKSSVRSEPRNRLIFAESSAQTRRASACNRGIPEGLIIAGSCCPDQSGRAGRPDKCHFAPWISS